MKRRPNEQMRLFEINGKTDIVFVIPTADVNGNYSKCCKLLYKNWYIIFVQSKGPNFNFGRSCNFGIKRALELNPKYVVISNDDIYKIDDINNFAKNLLKIKPIPNAVLIKPTDKKPVLNCKIIKVPSVTALIYYNIKAFITPFYKFYPALLKKYNLKYLVLVSDPNKNKEHELNRFIYKPKAEFRLQGNFFVLSRSFLEANGSKAFDETFINSFEDVDLFYKIKLENNYKFIKFKIGAYNSGTFRFDQLHAFRGLANTIYFNYKLEKNYKF
jgi:GT2 family glycosyltransferase